MDGATITRWIKSLGHPYDALSADGIIPSLPLQELYRGRDWLDIEPADGLELSFWAETKCLESIYITLIQTVDDQPVYQGELPQPFTLEMDQASVRATFGPPMESKGPMKLPNLPPMGGYDAYTLNAATHPNARVMFQYTADLKVDTLIFTLIDSGHD